MSSSSESAATKATAALLEQARSGSPAAVGSLLDAARGYLLMQAEQELPGTLRAKVAPSDIVQETAIDACRDFPTFQGTTQEELYAWLRAILRNNVTDAVRRFELTQKRGAGREQSLSVVVDRHGVSVLRVAGSAPDLSAIRREDATLVTAALARLPEDYAAVLRLRYWDGMTFAEIAARLDRSEDAARKLWYRAVACLDTELHRSPGPPPSAS